MPHHIETQFPVPSDLAISQNATPVDITKIATEAGIQPSELKQFGMTHAKVRLSLLKRLHKSEKGKYIVVAGMSPTKLGEGKSTTTIGLAQSLGAHCGKRSFACIRQPSQGPTFGIKGGAAGGGYAQVIPMEEFNLHCTGDIHAIGAANNLLAAAIDTRIYHEKTQSDEALYRRLTKELKNFSPCMVNRLKRLNITKTDPETLTPEERVRFARLNIDPSTISWRRVVDVNDRMLRHITIGQGPEEKGMTRSTGYDITVASEVMAILALSNDLGDMRKRLGEITVALDTSGNPVTAEDIGCAGAMAALLIDALEPTLMQTLEGTPVLVHAGPFANIAHGNSSIVADQMALKLVGDQGFVLTEAGFGADMGAEKFFNIKCRTSGLHPDCCVIVGTIRALKFHGGVEPHEASAPNDEALRTGAANIVRHAQNMAKFNVPTVVVLNRFATDTVEELKLVHSLVTQQAGAFACIPAEHWAKGGVGAVEASEAVMAACNYAKKPFQFLYPDDASLKHKIERLVTEVYGGAGVEFQDGIEEKLREFEKCGFGKFPVCMAKTQYSFSHDANLRGAPVGFSVPVRDVKVFSGARFVTVFLDKISTMPGLPTRPAYYEIDIDIEKGSIIGLS